MAERAATKKYDLIVSIGLAFMTVGCGGSPEVPPGTAFDVDGIPISASAVDELVPYLLEWHPERGEESIRSELIVAAVIPREFARHDFPEGVRAAKELANQAWEMLKAKQAFEEVESRFFPKAPSNNKVLALPISRRAIDPYLGAATFGKKPGHLTGPIETTFGVVIARVDQALPEPGPQQEGVMVSVMSFPYDATLADPDLRLKSNQERMQKSKIHIWLAESEKWIPPILKSCIVNNQPKSK